MPFIPRLESLRGIAALTVVSYHVWGQFSGTPSAGWDAAAFYALRWLSNGIGAVVGFFVISGFVLARSLEANPEAARYFRNRARSPRIGATSKSTASARTWKTP
jgi:exopolysaccharide production protein ExoZ